MTPPAGRTPGLFGQHRSSPAPAPPDRHAGDVQRVRPGRGHMHADLAAKRRRSASELAWRRCEPRRARRSCPDPASAPSARRSRRHRRHARAPWRGGSSCSRRSWRPGGSAPRPPCGRCRERRGLDRVDVVADCSASSATVLDKRLERLVARDEIGLGVDLDHGGLAGRRRRRRPDPRRRRGRISWRRRRGPSCAASRRRLRMSPAASVSALLQSIMPAPVFSRSSLTSAAVISAMCPSPNNPAGSRSTGVATSAPGAAGALPVRDAGLGVRSPRLPASTASGSSSAARRYRRRRPPFRR